MGKIDFAAWWRALCLLALLVVPLAGARRPPPALPDLSAYPWTYLRNEQPVQTGEDTMELIAVGDINLGRGAAGAGVLDQAAPWLQAADLAFGNLECTLSAESAPLENIGTQTVGGPYRLVAPAAAARQLATAGFDLLGLANNHALDRGPEGLGETNQILKAAGIDPFGSGSSQALAYRPVVREVRGVRLAFLAFNAIPDVGGSDKGSTAATGEWTPARWDPERAAQAVRAARSQADGVIVSFHWGYEYQTRVDPAQSEIARVLREAGADVVIGHHPHVAQPISTFPKDGNREQVVAYSLGNFVFDQGFGETGQGLALRLFFDKEGLRAVQALPLYAGLKPRLKPIDQARPLLERIHPQRNPITYRCSQEGCTSVQDIPVPEIQKSHNVEVDLTGDGRPEVVTVENERLVVSSPGEPAWESPAEWRVADVAAGDPNQDGRYELALAVWKPDSTGALRSHPFLLGYRGGLYRLVWGGSAVTYPILELELGDVDADGKEELVVLEQRPNGEGQAVTIWRWHGWGFSQQWRSPTGRYQDLAFIPGQPGSPTMVRVFQVSE